MSTEIVEKIIIFEERAERAIDLGYAVLVASSSTPLVWYSVQGGACTCKGYEFRSHCRHLEIARRSRMPEPVKVRGWR